MKSETVWRFVRFSVLAAIVIHGALTCLVFASDVSDLSIGQVRFFGYYSGESSVVHYIDGKKVTVKEGETLRLEFHKFDDVEGYNTPLMDVEGVILNRSSAPVERLEVRLSVSPKVARFVYAEREPFGIYSVEEMMKTASWFSPILCLKKNIGPLSGNSSARIVFDKIPLQLITKGYLKRNLWPTELKFEITVEPVGPEKTLHDNTITQNLQVPIPSY